MIDVIQHHIAQGSLHRRNISHSAVRQVAGRDRGLKSELEFGRKVLSNVAQLDQYLYTYGKMIPAQWATLSHAVLACLNAGVDSKSLGRAEPVTVLDYGAGQGLSTLLLLELLDDLQAHGLHLPINRIVQMDPSIVALQRASAIASCKAGTGEVFSYVGPVMDQRCYMQDGNSLNIHVFSNVIDVPGFDYSRLLLNALSVPGRHLFAVVSHDRDFSGGTSRIRDAYALLADATVTGECVEIAATDVLQYVCNGTMKAVCFAKLMEVL